jgi:uncharacterized membrane protein YqjE
MLEFLMRQLLDQTSWFGGLTTLLKARCLVALCRFKEIRQNLLVALCLWTLGFILVAISLVSFAAMLVMPWWRDYPLQALFLLSVLYAGAGVLFIRNSIRRVS